MQASADVLEEGSYKTFLPQRDGLEPLVLPALESPLKMFQGLLGDTIDQAIFAVDVYQLASECDALVFNMNGRVPDEGAVAEAAIAAAATPLPLTQCSQNIQKAVKKGECIFSLASNFRGGQQ